MTNKLRGATVETAMADFIPGVKDRYGPVKVATRRRKPKAEPVAASHAAFEIIKAEAADIVRIAGKLRAAVRARRPEGGLELVSFADMMKDPRLLLPRGEPHADDTADKAFNEAIRFWAVRVATQIDFDQWTKMVWHVAETVTFEEFNGDAISFYENRFEGLRLADGTLIVG